MSSHHFQNEIYIIEHLGCANCAAKMERKIAELPDVEEATLTFATKQLHVVSHGHRELLPTIQEICASIESEVRVRLQGAEETEKQQDVARTFGNSQKQEILLIGVSVLLFVLGLLLRGRLEMVAMAIHLIAYLLLGGKILKTAGQNILKGHVFDENFLMSIATLAAIAIGDYAEAVGVMLFFRIGELFEEIAVEKSRSRIMEAVDLRPETVQLVHGHHTHEILAAKAKVGDILCVRVGDRIPLDAIVVEGESRIDTAPVTGEPVPVKVTEGDSVISGCLNTSSVLKIRVEKTLEDSMVTRILHAVEHAAAGKPKVDRFITRFARIYTPCVVALAVATAILPSLFTGEWEKWIYTAITFLVISCPCALVLSVPLAFFSGIGAGSQKGILFKGGLAMETLKRVKAVVMDKTGTITKGTFRVQKCIPVGAYSEEELLQLAAECEIQSTHPIANSIVHEARERNLELHHPSIVEEIAGKGVRAVCRELEVLCGNATLLAQYQVEVPTYDKAAYGTEVYVACNGQFVGYIVISDELKEDSKAAIASLRAKRLQTIMLTGDSKESAAQIAAEVGISEVFAKLLPEEKLTHLQDIRKKYGPVMYVGDGINDAPVLAGADIGAAMGSGADAAIEAADVVFMTSSVSAIPDAIDIANTTNRIALQNIVFALTVKGLVMLLGLFGFANMWMAVFADTGVAMLCVLNAVRMLKIQFRK